MMSAVEDLPALIDYDELKRLASDLERPVSTLIVLAPQNDPFYAGAPARHDRARWFADLWTRFRLGNGIHLRRIHYRLISQSQPVPDPYGLPYTNTDKCWAMLGNASKDARYLGVVPIGDFADRRNAEPVIYLPTERAAPHFLRCNGIPLVETPLEPSLYLQEPTIPQRYHVELWAEKTTVNDVLESLATSFGLNVVTSAGEISLTACHELVERARASGRPVRILYLSDFDPAGQSMPLATARKIEFVCRAKGLDIDIQLRPVVLTKAQCLHYGLPRTPIKETERRADAFEARHGEGATELDALEALHPGELRRILHREISRYYDPTLQGRISEAAAAAREQIGKINDAVLADYAPQLDELRRDTAMLRDKISETFAAIEHEMRERAANARGAVGEIEWPEPRPGDEDPDPLFDSTRSYLHQVSRFKLHQDKPIARAAGAA
jgi:hypothetical protein